MVSKLLANGTRNSGFTDGNRRDVNVSHITAGYIFNSPDKGLVRVDKADDTSPASSVFNYANISADGLVDNTVTTYRPDADKPDIWRGYVNSNFPIFPEDILITAGASFSGLVDRNLVGRVASVSSSIIPPLAARIPADRNQWSFMYQGAIPVTAYVDSCNTLVGYDYLASERRTRATTQFFGIKN